MNAQNRQHGMTLIELMVTIAVMGIIVGLAVPSFQQTIAQSRRAAFLRDTYSLAMEARQRARASNQPVRLVVHDGVLEGVERRLMRWERLPCDGEWGDCPNTACEGAVCGQGGCNCDEMSQDVMVPDDLNVDPIHGVCWLPGSAEGRLLDGGNFCDPGGAQTPDAGLAIQRDGVTIALLVVDKTTGMARVVDCQRAGEDSGLCP